MAFSVDPILRAYAQIQGGGVRPPSTGSAGLRPRGAPTPTPAPGGGSAAEDWYRRSGGGTGTGGSPEYERDPDTGLWYDRRNGQTAPQWVQDELNQQTSSGPNKLAGLHPYDPSSGLVSGYPHESPVGSRAVESGGPPRTYADPSAGVLYDRQGTRLPQYLQNSGGSGGGGGGGSGAAYAQLAQRAAEFEYTREQDRLGNAMAILREVAQLQQLEDERAQLGRSNTMAALPYAVDPSMSHFPGFGPSDALAGYGLASPIPIQHTAFKPFLPRNSRDAEVQAGIDQMRAMAGL